MSSRKNKALLLLALIVIAISIANFLPKNSKRGKTEIAGIKILFEDYKISRERKILDKLNIKQKIGQLFIIGFNGTKINPEIKNLFKIIHPGGVILFSKNIKNKIQLIKLINNLQKLSLKENKLPLFIAVDQEGGVVRRIKWLNDALPQSKITTSRQAYELGLKRGKALANLGINLNLSPVLDETTDNDFLNNRSFQKEPKIAGKLAKNLILGQKKSGIFTAIKHFPGYGNVSFNPETVKMPILTKFPKITQFQIAMSASPEFVMTANAIYLKIDKLLPFSLSARAIKFLKKKLKGNYIIISDDLSSDVLKKDFSLEKSVIFAKEAGIDVLLVSGWKDRNNKDQVDAFNSLFEGIKNNIISEESIDNSLLKIIKLKEKILISSSNDLLDNKNNQRKTEDTIISEKPRITDKLVNWGHKKIKQKRFVDTIIIHSSYDDRIGHGQYDINGVMSKYKSHNVSPHYLIDRGGSIFRLVKDNNIAYHAGVGAMPDGRTDVNNFSIGIEIINNKSDKLTEAQYISLAKLIKYLKKKYEIKYILGHKDIAPGRKTDPWNFNWQKLYSLLK